MRDRPHLWILRGQTPVPVDDVLTWGRFMESGKRRVAEDVIERPDSDSVRVSTVFIGIDHNWSLNGPPILFETMVFGGPLDEECYRYATWDEAVAGHLALLDEAVIEGKVSAWQVREMIAALKAPKVPKT